MIARFVSIIIIKSRSVRIIKKMLKKKHIHREREGGREKSERAKGTKLRERAN